MNVKQHLPWLLLGSSALIAIIGFRHYTSNSTHRPFFITEKAQHRTIVSLVKAKGILVPLQVIQIGNLIDGIVRYLYVEENELVEEGQLLAEIDDSFEDTNVNSAFGNLDAAQAALSYQLEFLKRQQQLFSCKQISLDTYQQAERDYQAVYAKVEAAKGLYEQAKLVYDNKRIRSPVSGMIITKNVSIGQAVNNFSPPSVLYNIATTIKTLRAHIILDDKALDILQPTMLASMTLDTYPHKTFTGAIQEITGLPHEMEATDYPYARLIPKTEKAIHFSAIVPIDNSDLSLRPGMAFTATIIAAEQENVLSVPHRVFTIHKHAIHHLAHAMDYRYEPLDHQALLTLANDDKTIWILKNKTFIETIVSVGASNAEFVEITKGLDGSENIVYEVD